MPDSSTFVVGVPERARPLASPSVAAPAPVSPGTTNAPDEPLLDVVGADLQVPLVDGRSVRYVNLDNAASAPALCSVADRLAEVLPYYASVHRGAGYASQVSTALYEHARRTVAAFLGARSDDVTVVTRNTTDAINLLARCVPAGEDVVVLDVEHHANLLPWQGRGDRIVHAEHTWEATVASLGRVLAQRPAALVTVTGSSNVTGEVVPLDVVATLAHRHGARVLVDAAQLAPHRRIDIAATGIDYLALSGHKLYAPFGTGVLVGRRDWLDTGPPHLAGGGAVRQVDIERTTWAGAPERHEAGTPNVLGAIALAAACEALASLPEGALEDHERRLAARLRDGLAAVPGVTIAGLWPDADDHVGLATFAVDGIAPDRLAAALAAEHGIGVRDGRFCAHPLLQRLGYPAGAVRASVGGGSRLEDVDRLVDAVGEIVAHGPRWTYREHDGWVSPEPDTRPADPFGVLAGFLGTASPCDD